MGNNKITGKEIAEMAGVSTTAVSLVKTGKSGIGDETRKRIVKIMRQTGYYQASSDMAVTQNIVLLFRDDLHAMKQYFYNEVNASVINACRNLPYNLIITTVDYSDAQVPLPYALQNDTADAAIIYGDPNSALLGRLSQLGIPFVVLDSSRKKEELCAVRVDYETAAYDAVTYLISLGHKDIAYIGNNRSTIYDFNLLAFGGFQRAMSENGFTLEINRIQFDAHDESSLYTCIDSALSGTRQPTALFCTTDLNAILTLRYLYEKGVRVPEDISVIGIDDLSISQYTVPSLTTLRINREQMGRLGVELIGKMLRDEQCQSVYVAPCAVVVRESTASPKMA